MSTPLKFEFKKDTGLISLAGLGPNPTAQFDVAFGSTQGSVIYRSASAWTALTPGSSGQFLTTNGAAANPSWGTGTGVLPSQTSNSGKLLTTDGTNASWTTTGVLTSLTSPASTNLTLGTTSFGTALTVVSSNGQVGIGTTTPGDRLVVSNAGAAGLEFGVTTSVINQAYNRSTSNYVDYQDNCLNRIFATNGTTEAMRIASTGTVSIASTTAGSSGAGALVVSGGLATGAASYFQGVITANAASGTFLSIPPGTDNNRVIRIFNSANTASAFIGMSAANNYVGGGASGDVMIRNDAGNVGFSANNAGVYYTGLFSSTGLAVTGTLSTSGAATFAGAVTAAPAGYSVNASGTYGMSLCQIDNSLDRLGLTAGVSVSGATFTARYAAPMVVRMAPDVGVFQICVDSGKTIGNAYTPTGQLEISSTGATFAGAVSVGTGAAVGGATAGAGGLAFPAIAVGVADANTLDDYEEGTWTPTAAGATTAGTVAYSSQYGYYTKIGRLLYVWFDLNVSSFSGGVGGLTITNLPFPNANITNFYPTFQPWFVDSAYAQTYTTPTGSINPNTSVLILYSTDDGHANFASMNVNQIGRIAGYFMMQTT